MRPLHSLAEAGGVGLLFGVDHAAHVTGISAESAFREPSAMAESIIRAHAVYGHDLVVVHSDAMIGIEALGGRLAYAECGPPRLLSRPYPTPTRPIDPWRDGRVPVLLEAACTVRDRLKHAAFVAVSVTGPCTLAGGVTGESVFLSTLSAPGARECDLLECAERSTTSMLEAASREGLGTMVAEPLAALVGPSLFKEVLAPPLTRVLAQGKTIVHICGDSSHLFPFLPSLGAPAFSLDCVDLLRALRAVGADAAVVGGLTPTAIREGPAERVHHAIADFCRKAEGAFIPCSGCDLVWDTPPANVVAFVRGARAVTERGTGED